MKSAAVCLKRAEIIRRFRYFSLPASPVAIARARESEDCGKIFTLARNLGISRYMTWSAPKSLADTASFLASCSVDMKNGSAFHAKIISVSSRQVAGFCSLMFFRHPHSLHAEVATWLGAPFQGRRLGYHSKMVLFAWAFAALPLTSVIFRSAIMNVHSHRQLMKMGLSPCQHKPFLPATKTAKPFQPYELPAQRFNSLFLQYIGGVT